MLKPVIIRTFNRLMRDERGVTLVEYGIALALALGVGVVALTSLGDEIEDSIDAAASEMPD